MSYILDALKKSEAERQQGKAPGFNTVQPQLAHGVRRRRLWPMLLAAALLLNAAVLLLALRPWEERAVAPSKAVLEARAPEVMLQEKPRTFEQRPAGDIPATNGSADPSRRLADHPGVSEAVPSAPAASPPAAAPRRAAVDAPAPPNAGEAPKRPAGKTFTAAEDVRFAAGRTSRTSRTVENVEQGASAPATGVAATPKPAPRLPEAREKSPAAPLPAVERPQRPPAAPPAVQDPSAKIDMTPPREPARRERSIASRSEEPKELHNMPSAVRDEVPKLTFSFLVYSDRPEERMVTINGKRMREGDEVVSGLRLEEITPEGAVLNWKGQRFHKSVF